MRKGAVAVAMLLRCVLSAQDIAGDWQGTLKLRTSEIRVVINIAKTADGGWSATEFTPDEGSNGLAASSVAFQGSSLKLAFDRIRGKYEGTLNDDKSSIKGTWTQGSRLPLDLERATEDSSWRRDRTPHEIQFVTVESNVKLEVIDWGGSGRPLVLLAGGSNNADGFDKFAPKLISAYHVYGISRQRVRSIQRSPSNACQLRR